MAINTKSELERRLQRAANEFAGDHYEVELSLYAKMYAQEEVEEGTRHHMVLQAVAEENFNRGRFPTSPEIVEKTGLPRGTAVPSLLKMTRGGLLFRRRWSSKDDYEYRVTQEGREQLDGDW